jgi:peroxiredoxin Q/BCP
MKNFKDLGAEVIGISSDSVESHQNSLNNIITFIFYQMLIRKSGNFGVPSGCLDASRRVTYDIERQNIMILIYELSKGNSKLGVKN